MIRIRIFISIICCVWVFWGCEGTKKLSNRNLASMYAPEQNFTHPEFRLYNYSADSARLYFDLDGRDFLTVRKDSASGFTVAANVQVAMYNSYYAKEPLQVISKQVEIGVDEVETGEQIADETTGAEDYNLQLYRMFGYLDMPSAKGTSVLLHVFVTDLHRGISYSEFIQSDRTGNQSAADFLPLEPETGNIRMLDYTDQDDGLHLISALHKGQGGFIRFYDRNYPIALPPFSAYEAGSLNYAADKAVQITDAGDFQLPLGFQGIYHVQIDTMETRGFTYYRFAEDYPLLTDAYSLIESIRYLTTREEYDKLVRSKDKKEAVDEFWLKMAGNRERARVLIRNYYSRVQFANEWFTSYLEGWKSDRGLIYVIFGPPSTVYRDNTSESWSYSAASSYGSLLFTFDKIRNPFTDNDYRLRRNVNYKDPWYRAVDGWRDGKVVDANN